MCLCISTQTPTSHTISVLAVTHCQRSWPLIRRTPLRVCIAVALLVLLIGHDLHTDAGYDECVIMI